MKYSIHRKLSLCIGGILLLLASLVGCRKEPIVSQVSDQVNITSYLEKYPDRFSEFKKILDITGNSGFLQAYGNYTMFIPTNDGVKAFLQAKGKTSVSEVDIQELKDIVRFHLLEDTLATTRFNDGKLPAVTMFGQYLITGAQSVNGTSAITVNRQANIVERNVRVGNGYIHVIDNVLIPEPRTLGKLIEADPKFSIFTQALKETGLYDSLNIKPADNPEESKKYLTVIAESDAVLAAAGIPSYAALKAKYNKGNPDLKNASNGLHVYMGYHILNEAKYLADLISATPTAHTTLALPELVMTETKGSDIIVDEMIFNSSFEPGVKIVRELSDRSAFNGVLHQTGPYQYSKTYTNAQGQTVTETGTTAGQFAVKTRVPFPVYWDIADFPEMRNANASKFRVPGAGTVSFDKVSTTSPSPIKDWDWSPTRFGVVYRNDNKFVNRDYLNIGLGVGTRNTWMEFKTPLIVRGKYAVWICYERRRQSSQEWPVNVGTTARFNIDGGEMTTIPLHFAEPAPAGSTAELEALGWKYYTSTGNAANPFTKQPQTGSLGNLLLAKKVGVLDVKTTGTHIFRATAIVGSQNSNNIDMVHFIPVDWPSQVLPRFTVDGTADYTDYPGNH